MQVQVWRKVELHISENGIISARNIGSGEEKFIGNSLSKDVSQNNNKNNGESLLKVPTTRKKF
jgi:hypothetical protein